MRVKSEGRRALLALLQRTTQRVISKTVGVSQQAVAYWASGDKRPAFASRKLLESAYQISMDAWDEAPEDAAPVSERVSVVEAVEAVEAAAA